MKRSEKCWEFHRSFKHIKRNKEKVKPPTQEDVGVAVENYLKKGGKITNLSAEKVLYEPPEEHLDEIKSAREDRSQND